MKGLGIKSKKRKENQKCLTKKRNEQQSLQGKSKSIESSSVSLDAKLSKAVRFVL